MLTSEGCRDRRARLWASLEERPDWILLSEPRHLMYFANFYATPFIFRTQNASALLILGADGSSTLVTDNMLAAYAKQESTCPSKKEGGDLSFFPRVGAMVEPFAKAAFEMKVGDISDVVATEFGYHIVLVTAKQPGKQPTFEQAKEAVRAVYAMRLRDAVIGQMKPNAKIEIAGTGAAPGVGSPTSVVPMK